MAPSLPILVVEDEESLLDLMVLALGGRFGYSVVRARDGEEALVRAREGRPGVVVLDLNLPKVDGYEVARRLRADPATAHAWIIAISGLGHPDAAAAAGCDQFLWKPIGIDQLELAVRAGAGRANERWQEAADERQHRPIPPARPAARTELAAAAAALLDRVGTGPTPLGQVGAWFDDHEEAFRRGAADAELRAVVQDALAACWGSARGHLTDADARRLLRALAERLRGTALDAGRPA